jgi:hypothetical protein
MTTFEQYQQEFVGDLLGVARNPPLNPKFQALLDALPYYGKPEFIAAHRGTLRTLLRVNMASNPIAPQPDEWGTYHTSFFKYRGPYSGYADAFCHEAVTNPGATAVAAAARHENNALTPGWWQDYAIAVLTDAARNAAGLSLDTGKLTGDLAKLNTAFLPALTASVRATMRTAYQPTSSALKAINPIINARTYLAAAITNGGLIANINVAISNGGDSTQAVVWFLYILWITLAAVTSNISYVDGVIQTCQRAGLSLPPQIGPGNWWHGGYATWYVPLAGPDLVPSAGGLLTAGMPEKETTKYTGNPYPAEEDIVKENGYSQSLCYWGPLARYRN